ncbi:protein LURP-one-related 8-like [Nymphaea colorata]|nr:protein LURP-one-related 8-like [Nymphaea colorata]
MMRRVHSTASPEDRPFPAANDGEIAEKANTLTVWKKSLLFNCRGFTVFDGKGKLVFRVDKYDTDHRDEIVLMDAAGTPLLAMRKKKLSLGDQWQVFDGEPRRSGVSPKPIYCVKKKASLLHPRTLAHVYSGSCKTFLYVVHDAYIRRSCQVVDASGKVVAEVRAKESGASGVSYRDVFQLMVQPDLDPSLPMALVLLLDQMFPSKWSPVL